jgi:hypothetical protein
MKSLAYFAAGRSIKKSYHNLPVDKIYLIDPNLENTSNNSIKIDLIRLDALDAVEKLFNDGVKLDYFVSINEGLDEGGGRYAINGDRFMGFAMKVLKDRYIHIMSPQYYSSLNEKWKYKKIYENPLDLPYIKSEIKSSDPGYINPMIFSSISGSKSFQMMKVANAFKERKLQNGIIVRIVWDSIWCHSDLDQMFICIKNDDFFLNNFKNVGVICKDDSIETVLNKCDKLKLKNIGIIPWKNGRYEHELNIIGNWKAKYPQVINFFHLNKNDFGEIYSWIDE